MFITKNKGIDENGEDVFVPLKDLFEEARNAFKCLYNKNGLEQALKECGERIKDSFKQPL